mgnify:CR=1 FL=1
MPLNLEEILALPDIGQKINYLKKGRKTELPVSYTHLTLPTKA